MTWSWQPPAYSPVSTHALLDGSAAAVGLGPDRSNAVAEILRARYQAHDALLTDSGTSALILALTGLLPRGGTVAYPSYGCIDLTTAAIGAGMHVRLYDLNPATLSPDIDSLRNAIRRGVDGVVVTHLYGFPADMAGVKDVAAQAGVPVIEDAAQGAGGRLFTTPLGALGDVSILSFGRGKGTTASSGGALLCRTQHQADCLKDARSHLRSDTASASVILKLAAQRLLARPAVYRLPASIPALSLGKMVYHPPTTPRSMSRTSAAVLRRTLELDDDEISARRAHARELMRRLAQARSVVPIRAILGGESGFLRLPVLDQAGTKVVRPDLGILRGYPMTLDEHSELRRLLLPGEQAGKGSQFLRDRLFTLPTHSRIRELDLARAEEWFEGDKLNSHALTALS